MDKRCSERVFESRSFRGRPCTLPAVVERQVSEVKYPAPVKRYDEEQFKFVEERQDPVHVLVNKAFCSTHDPERMARREAKKDEERRLELERKDKIIDRGSTLVKRLGVGRLRYEPNKGPQLELVLPFYEVEKLLQELGR